MQKKLILILIVLMLALVSCTQGADQPDAMMDSKPTEVMMEEQMDEKTTATGVPVTGAESAMESTTTPEMMEKEMPEATGTPDMMEETHIPMMTTETPQSGRMEETEAMMAAPAWYSTDLTDPATGETFRMEDFEGQVVLVETFAQWCPTCLRQQKEFVRLQQMLGMPDDLVMVSLDVDPNEDQAMLQEYLEMHGFDWRFAIAPADAIREIGSLYGQQFLNPPSAPVLIIDRKGEAHPLPFGVKSAEDLTEALKPYLDAGME